MEFIRELIVERGVDLENLILDGEASLLLEYVGYCCEGEGIDSIIDETFDSEFEPVKEDVHSPDYAFRVGGLLAAIVLECVL